MKNLDKVPAPEATIIDTPKPKDISKHKTSSLKSRCEQQLLIMKKG